MTENEAMYKAALERIIATKPVWGIDPNARVNDPDPFGWNVHDIAKKALAAAERGAPV